MYNKKFLLTAFIVAMVSIAVHAQNTGQKIVVDKILGAVGDRIILQSDIQNTLADAARNNQQLPDDAPCYILEQSLISKILALQAERDSLPVTDEEVEAELDVKARNMISAYGSVQAVEDLAGKSIYQLKDDSRPMIKEQMLAQAMERKIVENVHITPTEVKAFFDKVPADSVPFLESELEIGQINIYPKAAKEVEEYIVNEMLGYKRQVESGRATFADLAKRYSEDPGSKERGGSYEINRNDKIWDPAFMSAIFRMKVGEISNPVKSNKFGYFLISLENRRGDVANVRMILRQPPVTETELSAAKLKLDSVRAQIITNKISFKDAAYKYSEDENVKNYGPFVLNNDGSTYVNIDRLDREMSATVGAMQVGDISQPVAFTNEQGKKGVRLLFLKSRSEPHRMNLQDDYSKIADMALAQKKMEERDTWLAKKIPGFYVLVDKEAASQCPALQKYQTTQNRGF